MKEQSLVGLSSLEEQLAIRPAVMLKSQIILQLIFHDFYKILFIFLYKDAASTFRCYLNVNVCLLKAISILI
jgi:hypothetical protein